MCEVHAYLLKGNEEEKILESVEHVVADHDNIVLKNIFGEEKIVKAKFKLFDSNDNKLLLQPL